MRFTNWRTWLKIIIFSNFSYYHITLLFISLFTLCDDFCEDFVNTQKTNILHISKNSLVQTNEFLIIVTFLIDVIEIAEIYDDPFITPWCLIINNYFQHSIIDVMLIIFIFERSGCYHRWENKLSSVHA